MHRCVAVAAEEKVSSSWKDVVIADVVARIGVPIGEGEKNVFRGKIFYAEIFLRRDAKNRFEIP